MISAILFATLAALPGPAKAAAQPDPAAFAADLAAEIDLATAKAGTAMSLRRAVRCAHEPADCHLAVTRFLTALSELTDVLERIETKTGILVFQDVVDNMSEADRLMLTRRYETLIMAVPFESELAGLKVPADMAQDAETTIDRYYYVADGIWNPAVFAFGSHLMELIKRRSQGVVVIGP